MKNELNRLSKQVIITHFRNILTNDLYDEINDKIFFESHSELCLELGVELRNILDI